MADSIKEESASCKTKQESKVPAKYREPTELTDAVLIVEDEKFHVTKAVSKMYKPKPLELSICSCSFYGETLLASMQDFVV